MFDFAMDDVWRLLRDFQSWSPPTLTLYVVSLVSIATAVIIGRLLSGSRMFTFAASYILLFFFAIVANFIARYIHISGMIDIQKAILATIAGQIPAVVLLFFLFKSNDD